MSVKTLIQASLMLAACAALLGAQQIERHVMIRKAEGAPGPGAAAAQFFSHVEAFDVMYDGTKLVKGAPYSAEAVTEMVQILSDGNRIARRSSAQLARDSKGRARREQTLGGISPMMPAGAPQHRMISIDDMENNIHWMLDPQTKTARKLLMRRMSMTGAGGEVKDVLINRTQVVTGSAGEGGPQKVEVHVEGGPAPTMQYFQFSKDNMKSEQLGKRTIEGLVCDGVRSTMTIPAGAMGNERAIEVVTETWTSPDLQTTVLRTTKDPRHGETTYKLTMIQRVEPLPSLFEVPPDYKVVEAGGNGNVQVIVNPANVKKGVRVTSPE
jgi:hypothetical protein